VGTQGGVGASFQVGATRLAATADKNQPRHPVNARWLIYHARTMRGCLVKAPTKIMRPLTTSIHNQIYKLLQRNSASWRSAPSCRLKYKFPPALCSSTAAA